MNLDTVLSIACVIALLTIPLATPAAGVKPTSKTPSKSDAESVDEVLGAICPEPLADYCDRHPWDLDDRYEAYTLREWEPHLMKQRLRDGTVVLELFNKAYRLTLEPADWETSPTPARVDANGEVTDMPVTFDVVTYTGSVVGETHSFAYVIVTSTGVSGTVQIEDTTIRFLPVAYNEDAAPPGLSVIYHAQDLIVPDGGILHDHIEADTGGKETGEAAPSGDDGGTVASHNSGPDRAMTLWADLDMYQCCGGDSSSAWDEIWDAWNKLNAEYDNRLGFSFNLVNNKLYYCDNLQCNQDWGMTSDQCDTLLVDWPNAIKDWNEIDGFETAHVFSQDLAGTTAGCAWQSGRYGATAGDVGQSTLNKVMAHEVGHNYNGDHGRRGGSIDDDCSGGSGGEWGRARCWWHHHSDTRRWFHCHIPEHQIYELTGVCLEGHYHTKDDGWDHKHYTLMWGRLEDDGLNTYRFSSPNWDGIRECNDGDYDGSYDPGNDPSGFGYDCTN